jgi:hypothetical protein
MKPRGTRDAARGLQAAVKDLRVRGEYCRTGPTPFGCRTRGGGGRDHAPVKYQFDYLAKVTKQIVTVAFFC